MRPIIKIENLSKMYRLGTIGTGTISHDLNRWWHKVRGREDPYLKIGEANVSGDKSSSGYVWALKDINIEVMPGEVLGIIGKNGAGKSTLLKILSRVTGPTTGSISYRGRIGSLLEVGTGFHRELTGRENIFLNGAILGMTKTEIRGKLDEIVDFAGVERYIDTPVKRYSSGMMVRLGFAVAAHLEPEILVVDEVLAVGDAEFQKKAIGKMQDVSTNYGRTILFVSHNMGAIQNLCSQGFVLDQGLSSFQGNVLDAVKFYSDISVEKIKSGAIEKVLDNRMIISYYQYYVDDEVFSSGNILPLGKEIKLVMEIEARDTVCDLSISIDFLNIQGELVAHLTNEDGKYYCKKLFNGEKRTIEIKTAPIFFALGMYKLNLWIGTNHTEGSFVIENSINFTIEQSDIVKRTRPLPNHMKFYLKSDWNE